MPQRWGGNQSPGEHAKQQIRDLGQAVRNTARKVAQSSPNTALGDKAISELQQRVREIVGRPRQRGLPAPQNREASGGLFIPLLISIIWISLFAIVTLTIGLWGVIGLSVCWFIFLFCIWPVPRYLVVLHNVWLGFFIWYLILAL
jgi:hypothetical protein